jgi:hypothetical protein
MTWVRSRWCRNPPPSCKKKKKKLLIYYLKASVISTYFNYFTNANIATFRFEIKSILKLGVFSWTKPGNKLQKWINGNKWNILDDKISNLFMTKQLILRSSFSTTLYDRRNLSTRNSRPTKGFSTGALESIISKSENFCYNVDSTLYICYTFDYIP